MGPKDVQEVLVVGRGVYCLSLLRILGVKSHHNNKNVKVTLATTYRMDIGSFSRHVDKILQIPRPDRDLEGFSNSLCDFVRGANPNLLIIPVGEETLFLSQIKGRLQQQQQACLRIFTNSSHDILTTLNDKYQFQKLMGNIFSDSKIPRTRLVKKEQDLLEAVADAFQRNKTANKVVVKPISGHGSVGAHIIPRSEHERLLDFPNEFLNQYPINFEPDDSTLSSSRQTNRRTLSSPYVVQEFIEGQEYSTLSLCIEGKVVAHVCYRPRSVGTHGFSPIRDMAGPSQWNKTLEYVQKVASAHKLTGHFGFDMMERYSGEMVALECNPRMTNGIAFLSPRFSAEVATRLRDVYLSYPDTTVSTGNIIAPTTNQCGSNVVPRHIMTLLATVGSVSKANTSTERMAWLEVASISQDDVWWQYDPLPFVIMMVRILTTVLYGLMRKILLLVLHLDGKEQSVTDFVRQSVVDEVVSYEKPTEATTRTTSVESVGGIKDETTIHCNDDKNQGLRVLVTGATGFLGGRVVRILQQGNWDDDNLPPLPEAAKSVRMVTATGRNQAKGRQLVESLNKSSKIRAQFVQADLSNPEDTYKLIQGHDVVIHCAALCSLWTRFDDYVTANVSATENVVHACHLNGVQLLVHVSSPSVCIGVDCRDRIGVNEDDPLPPDEKQANRYSLTKKMAESIVMEVSRRFRLPCIILRPRAIFGPGDTTLFPLLLDRIRSGRMAEIGKGREKLGDFTYVDNVVAACLCCLDKRPTSPKIYAITNDDPRRLWDIIDKICHRMKLKRPWKRMPYSFLALKGAHLCEMMSAFAMLFGYKIDPLVTRYTVNVVSRSSTFDISAAKHDLGYKPVVPFDVGCDLFLDSIDTESL